MGTTAYKSPQVLWITKTTALWITKTTALWITKITRTLACKRFFSFVGTQFSAMDPVVKFPGL